MAFAPQFTGSVTGDAGTLGTFYIICTQSAPSSTFSFNLWKVSTPWGFAQGPDLKSVIDEVFYSGANPLKVWLATGKSVWHLSGNLPVTQTAPDTTAEVGSK